MSKSILSRVKSLFSVVGLLAAIAAGVWLYQTKFSPAAAADKHEQAKPESGPLGKLVDAVPGKPSTLRFASDQAITDLGVKIDAVAKSPPPQVLRLPGTLMLDPNRLVHVHSRFPGELVKIGESEIDGKKRPLRYGDRVKKGQLLATLWSKEIGEKKSELVDALSRLTINNSLLDKLESVTKGIVAERQIMEARRDVEADTIAVTRIERTLRSWRLSDQEIEAVKNEAQLLKDHKGGDSGVGRRWAETEVRAAMDGVIIEKNFNVGDIIEPQDDLFKIADLTRVEVMVNVYEEDIWAIRALPAEQRKWKIDLKSDPNDAAIEGRFELIGSVIDPAQRTGVLIGWLDNPKEDLVVGQFVTATIELPADNSLVAVPESSLIEEGGKSSVFVQTEPLTFRRCTVDVVRRMEGLVLIRKEVNKATNKDQTAQSHLPGEMVVVSGAISLSGELENLQAQAVQ